MIACPSCATELPEASRFCLSCGARLAAPAAAAEERKTVTTLFCDLVAFTAMSEAADPEDVDALLRRVLHAAARKVIESHGGAVEKFIGDAVVGVFGVPAAHEDDPERAVRAGLRIVQALEGMTRPDGSPLEVRVGVNTGEALVRLDVDPRLRRGLPHRRRGERRRRGCRQPRRPWESWSAGRRCGYREGLRLRGVREPVDGQGQARAAGSLAGASGPWRRTSAPTLDGATRFVGRSVELVVSDRAPREGVRLPRRRRWPSSSATRASASPGSSPSCLPGSTRAPGSTTWRQGRCLPYGEGVTFWALAEIVKAHAGILDTDDRDSRGGQARTGTA